MLLTVAGVQVPVMPFVEMSGSTGAASPEQIAGTGSNTGTTLGVTTTSKDIGVAH